MSKEGTEPERETWVASEHTGPYRALQNIIFILRTVGNPLNQLSIDT